ncbi:hypothetical protein HHI36_015852 [Cryptolaemus montrouzieri]
MRTFILRQSRTCAKYLCTSKHGQLENEIKGKNSESTLVESQNESNELPEEPTTCCMSGCANCVWLDYAEKMSAYFKDGGDKAIKEINEKVNDPNIRAFLMQELRMRKIK